MSTTQNASAHRAVADVLARALLLPAWLEPRLLALGQVWWRRVAQADARASFRWMAANWQKVAAWWLTAGVGLSVLFGLAALITWQNPQAMLGLLVEWGGGSLRAGGKLAGWGSLIVLVLALPLILPGLLLTLLVVVGVGLLMVVLTPVLIMVFVAFGLLLSMALAKQGGSFVFHFIAQSLTRADQGSETMRLVRGALGIEGTSRDLAGKPRLMDGEELTRYVAANKASQRGAPIFLGFAPDGTKLFYWTEKNVLLVAATRAGKGRDILIPNLRSYPESVFVLDPKGENCLAVAAARRAKRNTIAAFDPYGLTGEPCARFNPLASLVGNPDADAVVTGADYLAEALIVGPADHWHESARGLIRALVLHLATASPAALRGRPRDLGSLRELLTGFLDLTLEDMQQNEALSGLVSRLAQTILDTPANERGSIFSTARGNTKWLDNPSLAAMFAESADSMTFEDFRDEKKRLSVFVCLPALLFSTYPQICRLLTTFALDTMTRTLTGRKRPVMFILDELAQLQRLPMVERAFTLGAGYGVQVWAVFQSVEQAKALYSLDTLYGSAGFRGFFKLEDPESCEFISKAASGVLSPSDVRYLPEFGMLALLDGGNPLLVERLGARLPPRPSPPEVSHGA